MPLDIIVPIYPVCWLSGTFLQNTFGTIPLVSENQEVMEAQVSNIF